MDAHDRHPDLVSVRAAADHLAISESSVRRLIAAGTVATVRIGRRRLVPLAELRRLTAEHTTGRADV
jgi:excisionase family DNA binding protein